MGRVEVGDQRKFGVEMVVKRSGSLRIVSCVEVVRAVAGKVDGAVTGDAEKRESCRRNHNKDCDLPGCTRGREIAPAKQKKDCEDWEQKDQVRTAEDGGSKDETRPYC